MYIWEKTDCLAITGDNDALTRLSDEVVRFLKWFDTPGDIAMALARSEGSAQRFYSMSAQICLERKAYYDTLESTQKCSQDTAYRDISSLLNTQILKCDSLRHFYASKKLHKSTEDDLIQLATPLNSLY
jgi:hypothetical protein